jgi:hypothetical protein
MRHSVKGAEFQESRFFDFICSYTTPHREHFISRRGMLFDARKYEVGEFRVLRVY